MAAIKALLSTMREDSRDVEPNTYLKAQSEFLTIAIVSSLIITFIFNRDFLFDNPILRMMGYNNPCITWDSAPAIYIAQPIMVMNVFCAIRYASLDSKRAKMSGIPKWKYNAITGVNVMFGMSACALLLIFVVTPDGTLATMRFHMVAFVQYIPMSLLALAANWWEAPAVTKTQWAYILVLTFMTVLETGMGLYVVCTYANDGVLVVNPILAFCIDWGWFATRAFSQKFVPDAPIIKCNYTLAEKVMVMPRGTEIGRAVVLEPTSQP